MLPDGGEIWTETPPSGAVTAREAALPVNDKVLARETDAGIVLENACLRLTVDGQGRIIDLLDKENGCPMLNPGQVMNDWRLYQNVQTVYDAWEMDFAWETGYMEDAVHAEARVLRNTDKCVEIEVNYSFGQSSAVQTIRLRAEEKRVDFITRVDWCERRKLLKAHFESNVLCEEAVHEIQFGFVKRPCHRSHAFAKDRFEVSNHRYSALDEGNRGFALLNDGLYGLSTGRREMALTLLRAPLVPDDTCDRGEHQFTYSLMPFAGAFRDSGAARAGYALNMPVEVIPGTCSKAAGIWCDSQSILLETIKPAEDGRGMILRLYESMGETASGVLRLPAEQNIFLSSMDETEETFLCRGKEAALTLRPFEIRTLRLTD